MPMHIVFVDTGEGYCAFCAGYLRSRGEDARICRPQALTGTVSREKPDLVVVDLTETPVDILPLLSEMRRFPNTAVVLLFPAADFMHPMLGLNVFCSKMPATLDELYGYLRDHCPRKTGIDETEQYLQFVRRFLIQLGISPKQAGFRYLSCILFRSFYAEWLTTDALIQLPVCLQTRTLRAETLIDFAVKAMRLELYGRE